ncbi:uncharacterized protein TNCV_1000111 [Trichonephila clavipes]|nr:uncharacterized protein TNCV_1000111 [Trichonephila clavipes]
MGRALDWFDVFGCKVPRGKRRQITRPKQSLTERFPWFRNGSGSKRVSTCVGYQNPNQKPSDFVYELLKIHKQLKLDMAEEKLLGHIISRLKPQLLDYVEVRHPQTTSSLLQLIDKYEERSF